MLRNRFIAAIMIAVFAFVSSGCASTVLINSNPDGAEVFIDGQPMGYTPTTYTDTGIVGSTRRVELRLDGYEVHRATIRRDAELNIGALVGALCLGVSGVGLLFGLWILDYPSSVFYELRPLYGDAEIPPAARENESPLEVALESGAQ